MNRSSILSVLAVVLGTGLASSALADTGKLADSPAFSLSPQALLSEANAPSSEKASDSVILLRDQSWTFKTADDLHYSAHFVYKVLTSQGIGQWGSIERRWEPWHSQRPVIRARVITPDGIAHELDPKTITDSPASENEPDTYSDARVVKCPLPAVAVGSVIEEEITEESTSLVGAGFTEREYLGEWVPVRATRLTLTYPSKTPFHYKVFELPELQSEKATEDGITHVILTIPAMKPQKRGPVLLPPDVVESPQLLFSTSTSWADNVQKYNAVVQQRLAHAPVSQMVAEARTQGTAREAVIDALLRQMQQQIRYTGVEFGDAAIVPGKPGETLQRKYGDCKDKAALLVTLLRGAGIPADLALLRVVDAEDVNPAFPGLDLFNHAIVYVPAAKDGPEYWIDATAQYLNLGYIPGGDQDRLALVIDPSTQELKRIPNSAPDKSEITETRDFFLSDAGPAHVVETSSGTGDSEAWYRANFGSADTDALQKNLRSYMQREYVSEAQTVKIDHPKGDDFSKPFTLRLEIDKAERGNTSEMGGAVWIPVSSLLGRLPAILRTEEKKPKQDDEAEAEDQEAPRKDDYLLPEAFVSEWRYRLHLPAGYQAKGLPADTTINLGPAVLTEKFQAQAGEILATFKLDSTKREYTPAEGTAVRKAAVDLERQPALPITFEAIGSALLSDGKFKEAIAEFRGMSAAHPGKAIYHIQLSRALLVSSCGEEARKEAKLATEAEPSSAIAWHNLGVVLTYDTIGRQFHKGFDSAGAEAAYRKALSLDPKNYASSGDLAILLEYDSEGERYPSPQRVSKAVDVYKSIEDQLDSIGISRNLLYAMAYSKRFEELKAQAQKEPTPQLRSEMLLTANIGLSGVPAATKTLDTEGLDQTTKAAVLQGSAEIFMHLRMYGVAADLLDAAAQASGNAAQMEARAAMVRKIKVLDPKSLTLKTPTGAVDSFLYAITLAPEPLPALRKLSASPDWLSGDDDSELGDAGLNQLRAGNRIGARNSGILPAGMLDVASTLAQVTADDNSDGGVRVRVSTPGSTAMTLFYSVENGNYLLLGNSGRPEAIAKRVLLEVGQGKLAPARQWLDWLREEIKLQGGDDPLSGPVFPRFWTKSQQSGPDEIRLAAQVLLAQAPASEQAIPALHKYLLSATSEPAKTNAELAYVMASRGKRDQDALTAALDLAKKNPSSVTAAMLVNSAYAQSGDWAAATAFLQKRLSHDADNMTLKRMLAEIPSFEGSFAQSEMADKKLADSPQGTPLDWNAYGWNAVLAADVTAQKITAVQGGMELNNQNSRPAPAALHTLSMMYAEAGQVKEAHEILAQAMDEWGLEEPNPACWLVFGRIAEQLGVRDTAIADYSKLNPPKEKAEEKTSSYFIAQQRLRAMHGQ